MHLNWVDCDDHTHGTAILELLNHAILTSTALYDYKPRSREQLTQWFNLKTAHHFPVIGLVTPEGMLAGFASFGTFRAFPAYKYTVEHAIYVHPQYIGQGLGKMLLTKLIERATELNYHTMIGVIDSQNAASLALHEKLGFEAKGTLHQVGYKFGRWLDVVMYQKLLSTPHQPEED